MVFLAWKPPICDSCAIHFVVQINCAVAGPKHQAALLRLRLGDLLLLICSLVHELIFLSRLVVIMNMQAVVFLCEGILWYFTAELSGHQRAKRLDAKRVERAVGDLFKK